MSIIEWIKKYPHTIGITMGLSLVWGGLAFWLGLPQMLIISGLIIVIGTISHAAERYQ